MNAIYKANESTDAAQLARPYIQAMACLGSINEGYGCETAREVVLRFLCNAQTWRGDTARRVKAELKDMLK